MSHSTQNTNEGAPYKYMYNTPASVPPKSLQSKSPVVSSTRAGLPQAIGKNKEKTMLTNIYIQTGNTIQGTYIFLIFFFLLVGTGGGGGG